MKTATFKFDILTNLLATGSDSRIAEIRPSAIRGELRWWFRVLGGVAGDRHSIAEQETAVFGGIGDGPSRSKLMLRVENGSHLSSDCKDADALGAGQNTSLGYLLFPLRSIRDRETKRVVEDHARGFFPPNDHAMGEAFTLNVIWSGQDDDFKIFEALIAIWGQIGSLGFRSRRCMGALAFHGKPPIALSDALCSFENSKAISLYRLNIICQSAGDCITALSNWLKCWRAHGRTPMLNSGPGFKFAKIDHDAGLDRTGNGSVMRPPLGLPIIQRYSGQNRPTNEWSGTDCERFASPVILRPMRTQKGEWLPLIIVVKNRMWPESRKARITYDKRNKRFFDRSVSYELINAMCNDRQLVSFNLDDA